MPSSSFYKQIWWSFQINYKSHPYKVIWSYILLIQTSICSDKIVVTFLYFYLFLNCNIKKKTSFSPKSGHYRDILPTHVITLSQRNIHLKNVQKNGEISNSTMGQEGIADTRFKTLPLTMITLSVW